MTYSNVMYHLNFNKNSMFCGYDDHTCVIEHKIHKYMTNVQSGSVTIFLSINNII